MRWGLFLPEIGYNACDVRPCSETDITTGFEPVIGGSNPSEGTHNQKAPIAQLAEQLPLKETVPGSIPGGCTR